ncbi:MAG TPA: serine/threonine-protein kinase [Thermogutta sp.]|nr:serine/threonine-protein kinase [Thermogutta sp.]
MASEAQIQEWIHRLAAAGLSCDLPKMSEEVSQITSFAQFLEYLVRQKVLTAWQAEELVKGRQSFLLGKYRLLTELGRGGMAHVFLAEHVTMERRVAIKLISSNLPPSARDRFLAEVRTIASLDHPNIVHAYNVDCDGAQYYLVMEYVEGKTLEHMVRESGPLPWRQATDIARQTALGLGYAHAQGVIHCDLKPANIIVNSEGVVKILDLGLARLIKRDRGTQVSQEDPSQVLGTVDYMAPELALTPDQADHRVDIYSLGCVLYFALVGTPPFPDGTLAERILRHQVAALPDVRGKRPDIPQSLAEIINRALAKVPAARFETANQMAEALERCLSHASGTGRLVQARALPETAKTDGAADQVPTAQPVPQLKLGDREARPSLEGDLKSGERNQSTEVIGASPKQASQSKRQGVALSKRRRVGYAVGIITLVLIGGLLAFFAPWRKPQQKATPESKKPRPSIQRDTTKEAAPARRPEDDPEAFREKLEEWMRTQMAPKQSGKPGK